MREHPAARKTSAVDRHVSNDVEMVDIQNSPDTATENSTPKTREIKLLSDGKLGELPEFLVYVYKTKKYDLL